MGFQQIKTKLHYCEIKHWANNDMAFAMLLSVIFFH